jgi:hypothetical protein
MAAQRKYSPRPILGKGEDLATALHQEVQAISNALTSLGQDLKNAEREFKDETDKAIASVIERFKTEITEINGRVISIAEWSIEMTNEIKGYARIDALNALRSRIEQQGDEVLSYAQYIVALNNTVNGKADVHVVLRLENLIQSFGDQILAYGGIIQEIQIEVAGKASAFALEALESIVTQLGSDLSSMSTAVTALRNDIISAGVPNRLANSEFQDWPPWVFEQAANTTGYELKVANEGWQEWSLNSDTIRTGLIHKPRSPYTSINNWAQLRQGTILVEPGQYYQASIYMSAHRCSGQIIVEFLNGAGVVVSGTTLYSNTVTTAGASQTGGKTLDSYTRAYVFGAAPTTAKYARVLIRSTPLTTTVSDSYLFFTCPLFGKALEGQTSPSPYTAGNAGAFASATRTLKSIVEQQGEDLFALAEDVTELSTGVKNPKPGQNMLVDPVFQITREGAWKTAAVGPWLHGVNNGEDWTLVTDGGENTPFIHVPGTYTASAGEYGDLLQENIPVVPGQRYQISCYLAAHRCEGVLILQFLGPTGTTPLAGGITSTALTQPVTITYGGGRALSGYFRVGGFVTAPSGAARATFRIRARWMGPSPSSVPIPWLFIARPFMGAATEEQTEYSDWAPGAPGNMFAHLRANGMVWADSAGEGTVGATYELKLRAQDDTGTANAGLGITAAKIGGVWRSQIDITAERFRVINPSTGVTSVPFQVVSGVTYIKSAFIQNATITNAHITDLNVGKLTAGNIAVHQYIKSPDFDISAAPANRSGWFIGTSSTGSGYAEFGSAFIRGQLTAGQITNLSIGPSKLANEATMIMATGAVSTSGDGITTPLDIMFYAGEGGEDRIRKYAIFIEMIMGEGVEIITPGTSTVTLSLRMETNGSVFSTFDITSSSAVSRTQFDPGLQTISHFYKTPPTQKTSIHVVDVESTWGSWAGAHFRTLRITGQVGPFTFLSSMAYRVVILGYKK